jgi:large subunit ribosomal protein L23
MSKPLYEILERPIITEKSVKLSMAGQYTFRCKKSANKPEIQRAIEEAFDTKIKTINTLTVKGKTKQVGRARKGKTADYKKAIITLAENASDTRLKEIFEGA